MQLCVHSPHLLPVTPMGSRASATLLGASCNDAGAHPVLAPTRDHELYDFGKCTPSHLYCTFAIVTTGSLTTTSPVIRITPSSPLEREYLHVPITAQWTQWARGVAPHVSVIHYEHGWRHMDGLGSYHCSLHNSSSCTTTPPLCCSSRSSSPVGSSGTQTRGPRT